MRAICKTPLRLLCLWRGGRFRVPFSPLFPYRHSRRVLFPQPSKVSNFDDELDGVWFPRRSRAWRYRRLWQGRAGHEPLSGLRFFYKVGDLARNHAWERFVQRSYTLQYTTVVSPRRHPTLGRCQCRDTRYKGRTGTPRRHP